MRMALRLTVQRTAWDAHIGELATALSGALVPVVKGNGYGFGRATLHPIAARLADDVCVGTIHELDAVAAGVTPVVLTPTRTPPATTNAVLTVGSTADVDALSGWTGRVMIKLQSSMRRYGATPFELAGLVATTRSARLDIVGYALHLPLAGSDEDRVAEVDAWLPHLRAGDAVWLSHLQPHTFAALQQRHPQHRFRLRLGTALWQGDKSFLQLSADVVAVHPVSGGDQVGYRLVEVRGDGHLVVVTAGSAHGVAALPSGLSPFHFGRARLPLIEAPHMHSSMVFAAVGAPCPAVGDRVDVQRPLIATMVDEIEWV
jgi:alanine racemase